jgi:membrane associated rhomboid family serine protease
VPTCYRHPGREAHIRCQRCDRIICPDCMRPAAVGFQCPECIAEGAKSTRAGRTAYGGLRPTDASVTSMVLIALNAAVWIAILATGGSGSRLVDWLALRPNGLCTNGLGGGADVSRSVCDSAGGTWLPGVVDGAYWQLVTSMFTHVSPLHIGFNMLALWVLGPQLEAAVGRARFLALYFLSGLSGSALVYWLAAEYGSTLGASGAIFGLMGALVIVALKVGGDVRGIMTWVGINFVITVVLANISWQGHLGGFVGGTAIGAILVHAPRGPRRTAVQVAGLVGVALVVVVAIAARTASLS